MGSQKIFFTSPGSREFDDLRSMIRAVVEDLGAEYLRVSYSEGLKMAQDLVDIITPLDLVVADLTDNNHFVILEVGVAFGLGKPIILLSQDAGNAFLKALPGFRSIMYRRSRILATLQDDLKKVISDALKNPSSYMASSVPSAPEARQRVFVSYSQRDREFLDRLLVHLKPLEKKGVLEIWADTRIQVGALWKDEIQIALESAAVGILLISADFLASDFIVENELPPLLASAEDEGAKIIPVIVKPSGFDRDPRLSRFQAINDPRKPLISMDVADREQVFADLARAVEALVSLGTN